jgi:hypothetical protein
VKRFRPSRPVANVLGLAWRRTECPRSWCGASTRGPIQRLQKRARLNGRSLQQEVKEILQRGLTTLTTTRQTGRRSTSYGSVRSRTEPLSQCAHVLFTMLTALDYRYAPCPEPLLISGGIRESEGRT